MSNTTCLPAFDGTRLRAVRRDRGVSADKLARLTELTTRQIWRMEAGERPNVRAITLARVAQVLDTSIDYLMGLTDQSNNQPPAEEAHA